MTAFGARSIPRCNAMKIIYSDADIAVCIKPAGVLSEGSVGDASSMIGLIAQALGTDKVFPVHRLDRETGGLMVYALNESSAAALSRAIAEHKLEKKYVALTVGKPEPECGEMQDLLYYDRKRNKSFTVKKERKGVKAASLSYETLEFCEKANVSRVLVTLHTGRTHQIRVQFASRKLPLCGDRKYGAPAEYGNSLKLTSVFLSFPSPKSGEILTFELEEKNNCEFFEKPFTIGN